MLPGDLDKRIALTNTQTEMKQLISDVLDEVTPKPVKQELGTLRELDDGESADRFYRDGGYNWCIHKINQSRKDLGI